MTGLERLYSSWWGLAVTCQFIAPWVAMRVPVTAKLTVIEVRRTRSIDERDDHDELVIYGDRWRVVINTDEDIIDHTTGQNLLSREGDDLGSAAIGVVLIGLPSLVLSAPVWLTTNLIRLTVRKLTGMSVDSWSLWLRLRDQLGESDRNTLFTALRNNDNGVADAVYERNRAKFDAEHVDFMTGVR